MKTSLTLVLATGAILSAATSYGAVVYDEASPSGDLSGVFGTPTSLVIANGANTIIGQIGFNGDRGATDGFSDADYFSFVVPTGALISSIEIDSYTFTSDPRRSFFGYVAGSGFGGQALGNLENPNAFVLFDAGSGDVLTDLAGGPLGPGTYSFWLQEDDGVPGVDYQITFTQVPEPSAVVLFTLGFLGLFARRGSIRRCIVRSA